MIILLIPFILVAAILGGLAARYSIRTTVKHHSTTFANYNPPLGLTPAELGYVFSGKMGKKEILSGIVSLGQKGLLAITPVKNNKDILHENSIVKLTGKQAPLDAYEKALLRVVEHIAADNVTIKMVYLNTSGGNNRNLLKSILEDSLKQKGLIFGLYKKESIRPLMVKTLILTLLIVAIFAVGLASQNAPGQKAIDIILLSVAVVPPAFLLAFMSLASFYRMRGILPNGTKKLKHAWLDILGFKDYLKVVEAPRLKYELSDDDLVLPPNPSLPYFYAFNLKPF
ncbi:MAG: Protein of unknown function rane [Candidatus Saccharibacteria bacterium]|nr:Protein of unknown function rane [Candidatus Saccharibacteria bacterium]